MGPPAHSPCRASSQDAGSLGQRWGVGGRWDGALCVPSQHPRRAKRRAQNHCSSPGSPPGMDPAPAGARSPPCRLYPLHMPGSPPQQERGRAPTGIAWDSRPPAPSVSWLCLLRGTCPQAPLVPAWSCSSSSPTSLQVLGGAGGVSFLHQSWASAHPSPLLGLTGSWASPWVVSLTYS